MQKVIDEVKFADSVNDLVDLKKIHGYESYYRIHLGNDRIGIDLSGVIQHP